MRIDSHQHFWNYNPVRDSWITDEMVVIKRDFSPDDLRPVLEKNLIDGCVAVQADQSEDETEFLLDLANKNSFVKGVAGWVDLKSESLRERLSYFASSKKIKGFRHVVQQEPKGFLLDAKFRQGISLLRQFNFTYDILIRQHQLSEAFEFVKLFPDQKFVIDHIAKPAIKENGFSVWQKLIQPFSTLENVYCKVSGLVTEHNWLSWKEEDFKSYLDEVVNTFGSDRLMYGSDWPVCLVAASYQQQLSLLENYFQSFSFSEKEKIFGENAINFYDL